MTSDGVVRGAMVLLTGGSLTTSVMAAFQSPSSPYAAPLIGAACTAMLALIGVTYRGIIRRIDDVAVGQAVMQQSQDAMLNAFLTLERELHPGSADIILEEMQRLAEQRAEILQRTTQAKRKKAAAASKA